MFKLSRLLALILLGVGCTTTESSDMTMFNSPFDVPPDYRSATEYSPHLDDDFVGIKIWVPEIVPFEAGTSVDRFGSFAFIPVSLSYQFPYEVEERLGNITDQMGLVVVSAKSGQSYVNKLQDDDEAVTSAPTNEEADDGETLLPENTGGYLTFNVAQFVNLPQIGDRFSVHIVFEEFQSNVVTFELVEK